MKQKDIKQAINNGIALDGGTLTTEEVYDLARNRDVIGRSSGVYGLNGVLVKDRRTGTLWGFVGRTTYAFIVS